MKKENLISLKDRTQKERAEIARKGGIKSGQSRRQTKTIRETFNSILTSDVQNKNTEFIGFDIPEEDQTHTTLICCAVVRAAKKGNIKAFETIMKITEGNNKDQTSQE